MRTLRFGVNDVAAGHLILVNRAHPFCGKPPADRLTIVRPPAAEASAGSDSSAASAASVLLDRQAANMLAQTLTALGCGHEIVPVSGYRTMREQQAIYADCLREHGETFTRQYVAVPGCSEHQTGLAIDLAENRPVVDFIRPAFPYTGVCGRFRELAARYGFIERYPAGRERLTGIAHEPWHFRYVGYPHSAIIREEGLTLEEYTAYLKRFPYRADRESHLRIARDGRAFEIFYVPLPPDGETSVAIPDGAPCQVSGNNEDGMVVTLWSGR